MAAPGDFAIVETLRNGLTVTIRALRPDDRERVARAVRQLDRESIYLRLFSHRTELTESGLDRIMRVDPEREIALIVTTGAGADEIVEEDFQGLGIARRLLASFVEIARARCIAALEADVLAENKSMLAVFERSGLPMRKRREGDVVHLTLSV